MSKKNKEDEKDMFPSLITAHRARLIQAEALASYKEVVCRIENAAEDGKVGVYIPDNLISYKISRRLAKDGFDTTSASKETWVYWGS